MKIRTYLVQSILKPILMVCIFWGSIIGLHFCYSNQTPLILPPKNTKPSNYQVTCAGNFSFAWNPGECNPPYIFQLSSRPNFFTSYVYESNLESPNYQMYLPSGMYYWRVAGLQSNGYAVFSDPYELSVLPTPSISTNAEITTNCNQDISIEFLSEPDSSYFIVEVSSSEDFDSEETYLYDGSKVAYDIRSPFIVPDDLAAGTYYYRVYGDYSGCKGVSKTQSINYTKETLGSFQFFTPTSVKENMPFEITVYAYNLDGDVFSCYKGKPELTMDPIWGNVRLANEQPNQSLNRVLPIINESITLSNWNQGQSTFELTLNRETTTGNPLPRILITDGSISAHSEPITVNPTHWMSATSSPVLQLESGEFDSDAIMNPRCFAMADYFQCWYTGYDGADFRIGTALSEDGGAHFTKEIGAVLEPQTGMGFTQVRSGTVLMNSGQFHMWYNEWNPVEVWHAVSSDGVSWTKSPEESVIDSSDYGSSTGPAYVSIIHHQNQFELWFSDDFQLGYAHSEDPENWVAGDIIYPVPGMGDGSSFNAPIVYKDGEVYKCWFLYDQGIGYGTSTQPSSHWIVSDANPLFDAAQSFDVVFHSGQWSLWYEDGTDHALYQAQSVQD